MRIAGQSIITDAPQIVELPYDGSPVATIFRAGGSTWTQRSGLRGRSRRMREMTRERHSAILRRAHSLLLERRDAIAFAIVSECGKPIREAAHRGGARLLHARKRIG